MPIVQQLTEEEPMKLISALLMFAFATLPASAGQGLSGDKATGTVTYPNSGDISTVVFDIHEAVGNRPAKGTLLYTELDPVTSLVYYYTMTIDCVNIDPASHIATFSGTAFNTNLPGLEGRTLQVWFYDGGTPGRNGDRIAGNVTDTPDCGQLDPTAAPFFNPWIAIIEGNLTIHASK